MPEDYNPVVDALQKGMQLAMQFRQLKQAESNRQEDVAYRKQELADREAQQKVQNEAADRLYDLQKASNDSQLAQVKHQQAFQDFQALGISQRTGQTPLGMVQVPGTGLTPTPAQPLVLSGLENKKFVSEQGQVYDLPPLAQSPEQQLVQQQEAEKERREQARITTQQQAESARDLLNRAADYQRALDLANVNHGYRIDEENNQNAGALKVRALENAGALAVVRLKNNSDYSGVVDKPGFQTMANRGIVGAISLEELNKTTDKKLLQNYALDNDFQFLPQKDVDKLNGAEQFSSILPTVREMITLRQQHPADVNLPFTDVGKRYAADAAIVRAAAPQASVFLSGARRFSEPELQRFEEQFMPEKGIFTSSQEANFEKYNSMVNNARISMGQLTKGLSTTQQDAIFSRLQSKGATFVGGFGSEAPPANPNMPGSAPPNTTTPQGPQPQVPQSGMQVWKQNPQTGVLEPVPLQQAQPQVQPLPVTPLPKVKPQSQIDFENSYANWKAAQQKE